MAMLLIECCQLLVFPDVESLGETVTTQVPGYEIKQDKFDIVSDAKKYLGETRESFGY